MPRTRQERNQRRRELRKARKLGDLAPASVLVKKDKTAYKRAARRRARQRRVGDVSSSTESCPSADNAAMFMLCPPSPTGSISQSSVEPASEPEGEPEDNQFHAVALADPPDPPELPPDPAEALSTGQGLLQAESYSNTNRSVGFLAQRQDENSQPPNNEQLMTVQQVEPQGDCETNQGEHHEEGSMTLPQDLLQPTAKQPDDNSEDQNFAEPELNNTQEDHQAPEDYSADNNFVETEVNDAQEDLQVPEDNSAADNFEEPEHNDAQEDLQVPEDNSDADNFEESEQEDRQVPRSDDDVPESEGTKTQKLTRVISRAFVREQTLHKMSKDGAQAILHLVDLHLDDLVYLKDTLGHLPSFKTMARKAEFDLPKPKIEILFRSKVQRDDTGNFIEKKESNLQVYPKKRYSAAEWSAVYEITWLDVKEVMDLHKTLHPEHQWTKVWISDDGVSPIRSSSVSFHIYCIMFEGCWTPYPIMIFEPNPTLFKRDLLPQKELAKRFLSLIDEANLTLLGILADGKVRPVWQQIKTQPAKFGCQYCEVQSVRVSKEDEFRRRAGLWPKESGPLTWSYKTVGFQKRTNERLQQYAARVLEEDDPDELRGVIGRSCLFDYNTHPVDVIKQVPHDYMHTVAGGVIKRIAENLFWPAKCKVPTIVRRYQTDQIDR